MDILAIALGKLDNIGRVVGMPGRVGAKTSFGKKKRDLSHSRVSNEEIHARVEA